MKSNYLGKKITKSFGQDNRMRPRKSITGYKLIRLSSKFVQRRQKTHYNAWGRLEIKRSLRLLRTYLVFKMSKMGHNTSKDIIRHHNTLFLVFWSRLTSIVKIVRRKWSSTQNDGRQLTPDVLSNIPWKWIMKGTVHKI